MANYHSYIPKTNSVLWRVLRGDQTFKLPFLGGKHRVQLPTPPNPKPPPPPRTCLPLNIRMCHSTEVKVSPSELPLAGTKGRPDAAGKQREREPQLGLQTS